MSGIATAGGSCGLHHRVADHASSGALRDLLEHHGASYTREPLSEGMIFGLSGALDLSLQIMERAIPLVDLDGRAPSLEIDLCRHTGLRSEWFETDDPDAGWEALSAELDAGRPTLLRADPAALDYHADRRHDTRHAIVVTGCDPQAGIAWVLDSRFPDPQRCSLAALADARGSRAWPRPARHGLLRLGPGARLGTPATAVTAALARVVHNMRGPHLDAHPHVCRGLAAIDALWLAWPRLPEIAGPRLAHTLSALRRRIRDGGTGGALYRSLQARFEHDAAAMLGSPQLGQAALICDGLSDGWRAFAAALDDEDAAGAHASAWAGLEDVRSLEHRHVDALEAHFWAQRLAVA